MIYRELSTWIAQSESWQAFLDFNINSEYRARYPFLERPDDFYISLISKLYDLLSEFDSSTSSEIAQDLCTIAKGLEIYSLNVKRNTFKGVNFKRNLLYIASLNYLADYPATSFYLLKQLQDSDFGTGIEKFLFYFLSRKVNRNEARLNVYMSHINDFLRTGEFYHLDHLVELLNGLISDPSELEEHNFIPLLIARAVLIKFRINNVWADLLPHGPARNWMNFIRFNLKKEPPIWSFFPSQRAAIAQGLFGFEKAFSLQTPTSSGKTTIAELIIYHEFVKDPSIKILYLAPFRALATELRNNLRLNLSKFNIKIKAIYGGTTISDLEKNSFESSTVLISTPEKFLAVENFLSGILDQYKVVICDEGHLIDNTSRGINYELLLSRLKSSPVVSRKFLFLSAIIPNIEVIHSWLGGQANGIVHSTYRPTQLELAFLSNENQYDHSLTVNPYDTIPKRYILNKILSKDDFKGPDGKYTLKPTTFIRRSGAVALKAMNAGVVALFVPTKGGTTGIGQHASTLLTLLHTNLPKPLAYSDPEAADVLSEYFRILFGPNYLLTVCTENGFVYHHGDLPQFVRELLEVFIRNNKIRLFLCTTTLAEGVNLPIKTLVVASARRYNKIANAMEPLEGRDLKNLIGRAGRAGKETKGLVIVANPGDYPIIHNVFREQSINSVKGYLYHAIQVIQSYLKERSLQLTNELLEELQEAEIIDTSIIQLLAEDVQVDELDAAVSSLVQQTLSFFQSDVDLKRTLLDVFSLRIQRIKPYVDNKKIGQIRTSNVSLRNFELFEQIVDVHHEFFAMADSPLDDEWLEYLISIVYRIQTFQQHFAEEGSHHISEDQFKSFIISWCTGSWYQNISEILNIPLDEVLHFMNGFIGYEFQVTVSGLIRYIELKRSEVGKHTSQYISQWTNFLVPGFSSRLQLNLYELGISERQGIYVLTEWMTQNEVQYASVADLKSFLIQNRNIIARLLRDHASTVSYHVFLEFMTKHHDL